MCHRKTHIPQITHMESRLIEMFTGIIEEKGRVTKLQKQGRTIQMELAAEKILQDAAIGDSISVNGVCLTITSLGPNYFQADVMPETFQLTTLADLAVGEEVNLERAMSLQSRFGGHIVQGHVDGSGVVMERTANENAVVFKIKPDRMALFRYMIPKGSIAIDGISLTILEVGSDWFSVSIIPHTLENTTMDAKKQGSRVNLECDVLGKYTEHLLQGKPIEDSNKRGLTEQTLKDNGFWA